MAEADGLPPPHRRGGADSTEDALRVLRALTAVSTPKRRVLPARKPLMIITIAVPIVLVIGLIVGASYLEHEVESSLGTSQGGSSGPTTLSTTEANLDTALSAAINYAAGHQHSFAGVTGATGLAAAVPSLSFPSVSNSASEVAVYTPSSGALVMTSFQPTPAACVGVLEVVSDQAGAVFGNYPNTASTGTYYFEAPPGTDNLCGAVSVEPPVGGNYLSATGFPTEPLP